MADGRERVKKLRWRSRRGMKELDVLLEAFLARQTDSLIEGKWPELEGLLQQEDDVLYDWISGRNLPTDSKVRLLIKTIAHDV